jgi:DNA-binding MarR family transcriptional regulator
MWHSRRDFADGLMSLEELAARVGKSPSAMSAQLSYLSEIHRGRPGFGLVRTFDNPNNARKKSFALTPKGQAVVDHLRYLYQREHHESD